MLGPLPALRGGWPCRGRAARHRRRLQDGPVAPFRGRTTGTRSAGHQPERVPGCPDPLQRSRRAGGARARRGASCPPQQETLSQRRRQRRGPVPRHGRQRSLRRAGECRGGDRLPRSPRPGRGDGRADQRELYEAGARVGLEADTNGDGRPDVVQVVAGTEVVRQDEDADYDGTLDRRFEGEVSSEIEAPAPPMLPSLDCGGVDRFWASRR